MSDEVASRLRHLLGSWQGTGRGEFPTIDAFRYREELRVHARGDEPELHFEQRTWRVSAGEDDGESLHWESGFLLLLEDGTVELLNAQQSRRVEVLTGRLELLGSDGFELRLESVVHAHDDRMRATERVYRLEGDRLTYEARMATGDVPSLGLHLVGDLSRVATPTPGF